MRTNYKSEKEKLSFKTDPELITFLTRELNCSPEQATKMIVKTVEGIKRSLMMNGFCYIRNLGRFSLKSKKNVSFKHFHGHTVEYPILFMLRFYSSTSMRAFLNEKAIKEREKAIGKVRIKVP
jgi:nucleoid DNA-binding protein